MKKLAVELVLTKKWRLKIKMPKYPKIKVRLDLSSPDGNAFVILGRVKAAMQKAKISKEERDAFLADAMSGDYEHLLQVCREWIGFSCT